MKLHFTQIKIRLFWFLSVSVKTDHLPHFHVNFCVIVEIVEKCFFFLCKCSISKLKKKTTTKGTDSSSLCRPFGIVLQHEWVHCPWGLCCVCDCSLLNQTKRKERSTQLHFLFLICYRKKKERKKKNQTALWVSCKLQITDLSYYKRLRSPGASKCSGRGTPVWANSWNTVKRPGSQGKCVTTGS